MRHEAPRASEGEVSTATMPLAEAEVVVNGVILDANGKRPARGLCGCWLARNLRGIWIVILEEGKFVALGLVGLENIPVRAVWRR